MLSAFVKIGGDRRQKERVFLDFITNFESINSIFLGKIKGSIFESIIPESKLLLKKNEFVPFRSFSFFFF